MPTPPPAAASHARLEPLEGRRLLAFAPAAGWVIAGQGAQTADAIASDADGNVYVVGTLNGPTDLNPSTRRSLNVSGATDKGYVAKYSPAGGLVWGRGLPAIPGRVAVDGGGNVFVAGVFAGAVGLDPAGEAAGRLTSMSDDEADGFLLRLGGVDGAFVAANSFTIGHETVVTGLGLDAAGHAFVSGTSETGALNTAAPLHGEGGEDDGDHHDAGFVAKFKANTTNLFVRTLAGEESDVETAGLAVDSASGRLFVIGSAQAGADLDPSALGARTVRRSLDFLLTLDLDGGYVTHTGYAAGGPLLRAVAADGAGGAYVVGSYAGTADLNPASTRTFALTAAGGTDAFVARLADGRNLAFARSIGGGGTDYASAVAVDTDAGGGDAGLLVGGFFSGRAAFNPGAGRYRLTSAGPGDGFVARFATDGTFAEALGYGTFAGESAPVLAVARGAGSFYVGGSAAGPAAFVDFDPSADRTFRLPADDDLGDAFIVRYPR